jgi:hypothetical protein
MLTHIIVQTVAFFFGAFTLAPRYPLAKQLSALELGCS